MDIGFVTKEIAQMLGKDEGHSTVTRLVAIVEREVGKTHEAHAAYSDFLADKANGYAFSEVPA